VKRIVFAFILALLALSVVAVASAPVVFAQDGDVPPEVPYEWLYNIFASITTVTPVALLVAFVNVVAGYLSSTPPEEFKFSYFIFTILISFSIGLVTLTFGWSYALVQYWLANGFLTWYIWKIAKIIAKKLGYMQPARGPPTTVPATA